MIQDFRERYPMGSLLTDLLRVEEGIYIVKAQVVVNNTVLGSGMAGSNTIEEAEDAALKRALQHAGFGRPTSSLSLGLDAATSRTPYLPTPSWPAPNLGNGQAPPSPTPSTPEAAGISARSQSLAELSNLKEAETQSDDLSDLIAQTDVEMQRIGWGRKEGQEFLERRFQKKSRHQLTEAELREFLRYLKQQPSRLSSEPRF
ncbi:hypothetical protein [Synechococcus sp. H65.1]|uniref:hypothetical protein n=1 Tax=unclassified Synechococcus TaxID=2626047 RepID=UPI0039C23713